jgi:flagellar biosynthetic protein FliP
MTVLGRQSLGAKAQLVIVQTDDARYVLGVTEHGVSVVDRLPVTAPDEAGVAIVSTGSAGEATGHEAPVERGAAGTEPKRVDTPALASFDNALTRAAAPDAAAVPGLRADRRVARTVRPNPFASVTTLGGLWPRGLGASRDLQRPASRGRALRWTLLIAGVVVVSGFLAMTLGTPAHAAVVDPTPPTPPATDSGVTIDINGVDGSPSASILTLLGITLLSVAPALLLMMSSFTKIFVVLAMTRNALSLPTIPPNQVLAGLALFLSLFLMWPVLTDINQIAVQPYIDGHLTFAQAIDVGQEPLRHWMLSYTREEDLALLSRAADVPNPADPQSVPMYTLIPAFMLSELRAAFVIGLVIFVPFLVIDLVVAAALMSMGMMMLPPVMISLPFKILLFVLVDGWGLIVRSLLESYGGTG